MFFLPECTYVMNWLYQSQVLLTIGEKLLKKIVNRERVGRVEKF